MPEVLRADGRRVALASVLQLVDLEALDGHIALDGGRIQLRDGRVVGAHRGSHQGVAALLELLVRPCGRLQVVEDADGPAGPPLGELMGLVVESCRLADEWARLAPLVLAPPVPMAEDHALAALLAEVDGRRALWELVEDGDTLVVRVVDALATLRAEGLLTVVDQRAPQAPSPLDTMPAAADVPERAPPPAPAGGAPAADLDGATFDQLVESGRRLVRARRLADARARFEQALSLRPEDAIAAQNLRRIRALEEAQ